MKSFIETLRDEIVVIDGAAGSFLMELGLAPGSPPEQWNLSNPAKIESMHRLYVKAGANIITTNTFNATRVRLAEWRLDPLDVNRKGVEIALRAAEGKAWVFGSVGPLGKFVAPLGELSFDEVRVTYREQIEVLVKAGVHGIIVETISDIKEMKAILIAAREVFAGPLIAQMTFGNDGRTVTGSPPEVVAATISALGVDALGANCGTGPDQMLGVIKRFAPVSHLPLVAQPNAGVPELRDGRSVYPAPPEELARHAAAFVEAGCHLVGSCCGSTPDHTRAIAAQISGMNPVKRRTERGVKIASRTRCVVAGASRPLVVVGERINPSGRPALAGDLKRGNVKILRDEAIGQVERGAHCLDLNVHVPDTDEAGLMSSAARAVERVVDVPIFVDSLSVEAIENAIKILPGRCVINSVPAQKERLDVLLPLASRYGCAIVALALGESGVAEGSSAVIKLLEVVLREGERYGLGADDIFFDPAVLSLATRGMQARRTLEALREIRERGWTSIIGLSNISHGMPQRSILNTTFLAMAMGQGLDAVLLNPLDERMKETLLSSSALSGDDVSVKRFTVASGVASQEVERAEEKTTDTAVRRPASPAEALEQALVQGEKEEAVKAAEHLLEEGKTVGQVIEDFLVPVMRTIGERFERGELFLPHIVMSAEAAQGIFTTLSARQKGVTRLRGKIVIATVEGDVHDIGKNLVAMMLRTHGYEVVDLGKGVSCTEIVKKAVEIKADVVALSALLTTTMPRMGEVAVELRNKGVSAKVLVGGAPVNRTFAEKIGAQYAPNAVEAVRSADEIVK